MNRLHFNSSIYQFFCLPIRCMENGKTIKDGRRISSELPRIFLKPIQGNTAEKKKSLN